MTTGVGGLERSRSTLMEGCSGDYGSIELRELMFSPEKQRDKSAGGGKVVYVGVLSGVGGRRTSSVHAKTDQCQE